jgi:[acyl-carrier-protein] S-malonyltransferase
VGTPTSLVNRNLKGVATLALKTPAELDKARALLAEHGAQENNA